MLPNDPYILVSVVNTYLRDKYDSLDILADKEDIDINELKNKLLSIDYEYDIETNQFKKR